MDWFKRKWRALSFVGGLIALGPSSPRCVWWIIVLPAPWNVARAVPGMLRERLLADIGWTLFRVLAALLVACVFGIPAGLFLGYRQRAYKVVEGPFTPCASFPLPRCSRCS